MNQPEFWMLIETTKAQSKGNSSKQERLIEESLLKLSVTEILEFNNIYWELMAISYSYDLWAAATLLKGSCGDDHFIDFRGWLIAQGESAFYHALKDPEILAGIPEDRGSYKISLTGCIIRAYKAITGESLPPPTNPTPMNLTGENWDEDDVEALIARYPKLAIKYKEKINSRYFWG